MNHNKRYNELITSNILDFAYRKEAKDERKIEHYEILLAMAESELTTWECSRTGNYFVRKGIHTRIDILKNKITELGGSVYE
jgi:hypothetical protein